jgi:putative transposase
MKSDRSRYSGYRFPPEIISYAVWAYHRFCLSFRDVEDLLAERGIIVSYETIRQWSEKFGPAYARRLKRREGRLGDHWYLDEVFIRINGQQQYLWRAVDQDGDVIDILVQPRRDQRAAERFFRRLLRGQGAEPLRIITDKLRSKPRRVKIFETSENAKECNEHPLVRGRNESCKTGLTTLTLGLQ